jgi:conjugative relaxase-like TrwC/TraI family protein
MLSIGKLTAGREDYYLSSLTVSDEYYLNPTEIPGVWHGALAPVLGLDGPVDANGFRAVLDGRHPDGRPLIPGVGSRGRVTGFDLTFSAPKSVSLLWALAEPATAAVVVAAHDAAVADAFAALEAEAIVARRGHGGTTRIRTGGLVAAGFGHRSSRAGDPQLHTHLVTANLTLAEDGHWSSPYGQAIYGWAKTVGYLYQASLRARLTEILGVTWTPVTKGVAEIDGITKTQRDLFSSRRAEITDHLDRYGHTSSAAARTATLATRTAKDRTSDLDHLRAEWVAQATSAGLAIDGVAHHPRTPEHVDVTDVLVGPDGLTAQRTSFDRRLVLQALASAQLEGSHARRLLADADRFLGRPDVVALSGSTTIGQGRYTTAGLLAVEAGLVEGAARRVSERVGTVPDTVVERVIAGRPTLSEEQATMVRRLTMSGVGVEVVIGRAGTGKTFALDAARAAWEQAGHPVIGTALAAKAAAGLRDGTGIRSGTLDRLLVDLDRPGPLAGLPPHSVVVVDEAGMVGTRKLDRLLTHAARAGAKVVLVGDPRQLPEIDAGGTLAALAGRLDPIELTTNRRQEQPWERDALDQLRHGTVATAVAAYHRAGRITLAATADTARRTLVDDWWGARQGITNPNHVVAGRADHDATARRVAMYAVTRADVDDLNRRARTHLRDAGLLIGPDVTIVGRDFAIGDEVLALRNDRRLGIRNGTTGTVTHLDADGATITTATGALTVPTEYLTAGHLTHNYATTVHKSQGTTVDHAFLLGSEGLFREAGYVGMSRARIDTRLYLVEPEPFLDRAGRQPAQLHELVQALSATRAHTLAVAQLPNNQPGSAFRDPSDSLIRPAQRNDRGAVSPDANTVNQVQDPSVLRAVLLTDPPAWVTESLGSPPLWGPQRDRWADTATGLHAYRAARQLDGAATDGPTPSAPSSSDPQERTTQAVTIAIGPEPDDSAERRIWNLARLAITRIRNHGIDRELDRGRSR